MADKRIYELPTVVPVLSTDYILVESKSGGSYTTSSALLSSIANTAAGITAVGASTADVLSVSGSDLVADDGGLIDSSDPFIKWDDVAGKLVYANPLSRPSGAMYVGIAPTDTALGTDALCLQSTRSISICVPSGTGAIAIGRGARATGTSSLAIGPSTTRADALDTAAIAIGANTSANSSSSTAVGKSAVANAANASAFGAEAGPALRGGFATRTFNTVYWAGQTTNDSANVELFLDNANLNRMIIASNTMVVADLMIAANQAGVANATAKAMFCRRTVAIRRDNANSTILVGNVQTVGNDQLLNAPTWSILIDADDGNESLRFSVTGATGETVNWRATAFYRVV